MAKRILRSNKQNPPNIKLVEKYKLHNRRIRVNMQVFIICKEPDTSFYIHHRGKG